MALGLSAEELSSCFVRAATAWPSMSSGAASTTRAPAPSACRSALVTTFADVYRFVEFVLSFADKTAAEA